MSDGFGTIRAVTQLELDEMSGKRSLAKRNRNT